MCEKVKNLTGWNNNESVFHESTYSNCQWRWRNPAFGLFVHENDIFLSHELTVKDKEWKDQKKTRKEIGKLLSIVSTNALWLFHKHWKLNRMKGENKFLGLNVWATIWSTETQACTLCPFCFYKQQNKLNINRFSCFSLLWCSILCFVLFLHFLFNRAVWNKHLWVMFVIYVYTMIVDDDTMIFSKTVTVHFCDIIITQ